MNSSQRAWRSKWGQILFAVAVEFWMFFFTLLAILIISIFVSKVEKTLKGTLDSIPSPLMKIQIMGGKVCLRCKGKTLLGVVNELLNTKSLLTSPSKQCFALFPQVNFPSTIWIFTEVEGDWIKSRLSPYIFSTLLMSKIVVNVVGMASSNTELCKIGMQNCVVSFRQKTMNYWSIFYCFYDLADK